MGKRLAALFLFVCILLVPGALAAAITTSADDGDDVPGAPDVRRVTHVDNGGDVAFYVEFFENHDNSNNWPARTTCTWDLDFNNNPGNVEMLVIFGPSATSKVYRITYRSGGPPDKRVDPPAAEIHQAAPTGGSSTANNTIRVPVPKSEMVGRGMAANATSYKARAHCSYSGPSTGNDYVPDDRMFGITHTFGAVATPAPTTAFTAAPTPSPTPTVTSTPVATITPTSSPTTEEDDTGIPAAAIGGIAAGAAAIAGGTAFALWRRRRDE